MVSWYRILFLLGLAAGSGGLVGKRVINSIVHHRPSASCVSHVLRGGSGTVSLRNADNHRDAGSAGIRGWEASDSFRLFPVSLTVTEVLCVDR
jgi:hypothetical protein